MSPFWISLELRMMEVVLTTGAIRYAKLLSNHHHQQPKPSFFRPDALPVAQPTLSKHWREKYHISQTCLPRIWGLPTLFLTTKAPGYLGDGCQVSPLTPVAYLLTLYCITDMHQGGLAHILKWICTSVDFYLLSRPRAGSGVVRMDPLRFLAGCRTRRLNQA